MSMIPFSILPRSMFNMNEWFKPMDTLVPFMPTTLDMFDPFDELDHAVARNMQWLNKPEFIKPFDFPTVPQKYRITVDVCGYTPQSIKTEWKDGKLVVTGREEVKHEGEDFSIKEFKKTYELPTNAEPEKLVSFATSNGQLVIEVPLKEMTGFMNNELFPQVTDQIDGGKQVWFNCTLPQGVDPSKVHVTCKDRDVIIKVDDVKKKPDGISKMHFYKRSTMPPNTKFEDLKCTFDNGKNTLSIKAPIDMDYHPHHVHRSVPIEWTKGEQTKTTMPICGTKPTTQCCGPKSTCTTTH
jgi:HSP20 family molecular chaperone IbpA